MSRSLILLLILLAVVIGGGGGVLGVKFALDAGLVELPRQAVAAAEEPAPPAPKPATVPEKEADYGPDWPVCRDMGNDPKARVDACSRLLEGAPLSDRHKSWTYNNRGTGYDDLREYDLAIKDFEAAISIDDTNHAPFYNLGGIALELRRPKDAVALFDKAIARKPEVAEFYCSKSRALQALGTLDSALAVLDEIPDPEKENACVFRRRGEIALTKGDEAGAISHFRKAESDPGVASQAQCRAGDLLRRAGRLEEALQAYMKGVQLNPKNECAVANVADLVVKLRPPREADRMLDNILGRYPDLAVLQCYKGRLMEHKDAARAFDIYDAVLKKNPTESCTLFSRAHLMFRTGEHDSALEAYTSALQIVPFKSEGWLGRGQINFYDGNLEQALSDITAALLLEPEYDEALMMRGELHLFMRQYDAALQDFQRANALKPGQRVTASFLAESQLELGKFEDVIVGCQALIRAESSDEIARECRRYRARAYLGLKQPDAAAEEIRALVALEKTPSDAGLYLTAIELRAGAYESAAAALASYRTARPGDLYGALWAVLMAPEGEAIPKDIVALAGQQDVWPLPLLRYALGEIDADQVMQATNVPDFSLTTMRAAEAEFYIGLIHLTRDEMDKRVDRFRRLTAEAPVVVRKRQYPALYKHDNRLEVTLGRWLFEG